MSIKPYRLAVVETDDGPLAVVEQDDTLVPLHILLQRSGIDGVVRDIGALLEEWPTWQARLDAALAAQPAIFQTSGMRASEARFGLPIATPGNLICIGANYHDHVAEMPIPMVPTHPYAFLKPVRSSLRATGEPVLAPRHVHMMDWEAELAVVIGQRCKDTTLNDALSFVAGYVNFNDLSARDWIANRPAIGVDWVMHKAHDGFAPMGPYFVPAQFIPDPQDLPVTLRVNGVVKQASTTGQMIFGVAQIIVHLSKIMTLYPGDVIATGTPAGVGHGRKPPEYLGPGDTVEMAIGTLGTLVTPIV